MGQRLPKTISPAPPKKGSDILVANKGLLSVKNLRQRRILAAFSAPTPLAVHSSRSSWSL